MGQLPAPSASPGESPRLGGFQRRGTGRARGEQVAASPGAIRAALRAGAAPKFNGKRATLRIIFPSDFMKCISNVLQLHRIQAFLLLLLFNILLGKWKMYI